MDKAINKILKKAKKAGRKLMRKLGIGTKEKPKNKEQHDEQVKAGLLYLHQQEKALDKDGNKALTLEEAQQVAAKTKKKFKVFDSITPRKTGTNWVYDWKGSSGTENGANVDNESEEKTTGRALFGTGLIFKTKKELSLKDDRSDKRKIGHKVVHEEMSGTGFIVGDTGPESKYVKDLNGKESAEFNILSGMSDLEARRKHIQGSGDSERVSLRKDIVYAGEKLNMMRFQASLLIQITVRK